MPRYFQRPQGLGTFSFSSTVDGLCSWGLSSPCSVSFLISNRKGHSLDLLAACVRLWTHQCCLGWGPLILWVCASYTYMPVVERIT